MSGKIKLLTGIAAVTAAAGLATPASAQYYPAPGYGYGTNNGTVGRIIGNILGYGRYPYGNYGYNNYQSRDRMAIDQCARAAEARMNGYGGYGYGGQYGGGYGGQYGGGYGYGNQGYGGGARVAGISRVERKSYGFRVYGVATDRFGSGYGYQSGYGAPTIRFNCKVEYNGRVRDVDINRNMSGYRYGYGW